MKPNTVNLCTSTYVSRVGRLGNSLMQIATTIAYGLDHEKKPVFTKWDYQMYVELDLVSHSIKWEREAEAGLSYKPLNFQPGDVDLHGHFLSENYFKHHRQQVLDKIKLKKGWGIYLEERYGHLFDHVSIHVRRKDYLQPDQLKTHGVLGMEYYRAAMNKFPGEKFFICSDDPEWCKINFPGLYVVEKETDIIDLFLMSKCKGHIIANSTFSWWAAWISGNKTVAPVKFFVDGHSWPGLYRDNWIVI